MSLIRRRSLWTTKITRHAQMLDALLAAAHDHVYLIDRDGRYRYASAPGARVLGLTPEQMVGRTGHELGFPAEVMEHFAADFRAVFAGGQTVTTEIDFPTAAGQRRYEYMLSPFPADGEIEAVVATVRDVTERRQAQAALRRASEFSTRVTENIACAVCALDLEGRFTFANRRAAEISGYGVDELLGRPYAMLFTGQELAGVNEQFARAIRGEQISGYEATLTRKDGGRPTLRIRTSPLLRDGQIETLVATADDVTERLRAERQLAAQYAVARVLAESPSLVEAAPRLLQAVCEAAGWDLGELWQVCTKANVLRWAGLWHAPGLNPGPFALKSHGTTFAPGAGLPGRVWTSGRPRWIPELSADKYFVRLGAAQRTGLRSAFAFPIRHGGHVVGVMAFFKRDPQPPNHDLLHVFDGLGNQIGNYIERKRGEERLERSEEKLRALANRVLAAQEVERTRVAREIHDELGQVLTAVKFDLVALAEEIGTRRRPASEQAQALVRTLDDTIGTVQRITAELRPGILDELGLAAAVAWQLQEFKRRTGVRTRLRVTPAGADLAIERERATTAFRILQEALTNVARHARASRVEVTLRQDDSTLFVKIGDNGKGISKTQAASTRSLGLVGMRERASLWDGCVHVAGARGRGTRVSVRIPLAAGSRRAAQEGT
ncbi:MAG: PAS domain S-box protein [Deltaproteobacteria bacterium]|nr:PAS domain S-box protein [Deltaproteobacteria bacterium]